MLFIPPPTHKGMDTCAAIQNIGETGATIEELSRIVHLDRHALSKHLDHLRADGRVSYKQIGRAKVWFVNRTPLQHISRQSEEEKTYTEKIFSRILADMPEGVLILDFDYNILFMNRYLTTLYGDCIRQKYFHVFFGSSQDPSRIAEVIEGKAEEVESCVEDKNGTILEIKTRRIKNLSELHRLIGESVNRSYTIDQLCTIILKQLQDVIGFDMGDIQIYNPDTEMLFSYAQIGNPHEETSEVKDWKRKIAAEAIHRKETFFFDSTEKGTDAQTRLANNLQEVHAIPLKTKGEIHGALIIYTRTGRSLSKEDRRRKK